MRSADDAAFHGDAAGPAVGESLLSALAAHGESSMWTLSKGKGVDEMKTTLHITMVIILLLPTVFVGCSDSTGPVTDNVVVSHSVSNSTDSSELTGRKLRTIDTELADVAILPLSLLESGIGLRVDLEVTWPDGALERLSFSSSAQWLDCSQLRFNTRLENQEGEPLWEYVILVDTLVPESVSLTERVRQDWLIITTSRDDLGMRQEAYEWNDGTRLELNYPEEVLFKYANGDILDYIEMATVDSLTRVFRQGYRFDTALENNCHGMLTNDIIFSLHNSGLVPGGPAAFLLPDWLESLCGFLTTATYAKCVFGGGPSNPLCYLLGIGAVICWFIYAVIS